METIIWPRGDADDRQPMAMGGRSHHGETPLLGERECERCLVSYAFQVKKKVKDLPVLIWVTSRAAVGQLKSDVSQKQYCTPLLTFGLV